MIYLNTNLRKIVLTFLLTTSFSIPVMASKKQEEDRNTIRIQQQRIATLEKEKLLFEKEKFHLANANMSYVDTSRQLSQLLDRERQEVLALTPYKQQMRSLEDEVRAQDFPLPLTHAGSNAPTQILTPPTEGDYHPSAAPPPLSPKEIVTRVRNKLRSQAAEILQLRQALAAASPAAAAPTPHGKSEGAGGDKR